VRRVHPCSRAAVDERDTQSKWATAGYSSGAKCRLAPSIRTEPVVTITSPTAMSGWIAPVVPTRRNVRTPSCASSSTAIDVDGPPMPVEHTTTGVPPVQPSQLVYSRLAARAVGESNRSAIFATRPGSPGRIASVAPWSFRHV
jgi:hypothetical protein